MDQASPLTSAQDVLLRETWLLAGSVPDMLDGHPVPPGQHRLAAGAFLLHAESGARFLYRRGQGHVRVDAPAGIDPAEIALWHNGSVYSAVAALNGLRPFHASAVAHGGGAIGFTAAGGGGKSTMAAALTRRGHPLFADDTLVLDLTDLDQPLCLPGHKRLKLTAEALAYTGLVGQEQVAPDYPKHYALPAGAVAVQPLPLTGLVFLEFGDEFRLEPISGSQRFALLQDDHDTDRFWRAANGHDPAGMFAAQAALARTVPMWRLVRPRDLAQFEHSLDLAEQVLERASGGAA